ncbi:MAG: pyrimidine-nucleoside phosphorylase [Hydrogeniiclostridium sp.]
MRMYDILLKKKRGQELSERELHFFVEGYTRGEIPDYQASALLMAICLNGMTERETTYLTVAMAESGDMLDLSSLEGITVDKHSTGGVGDKTTLIVIPILASLGLKAAKMSGRGLGHTGGTIDKLESIPGFCTELSREEFLKTVKKTGAAIAGQTGNLVPADKKLYALRDVTATVESIPLIASSIMSKKLAAGAQCILLDVKAGSGAFMKTLEEAQELARVMTEIGNRAGRRTGALITNMDRPLGYAVGNALEVAEACETLRGRGPEDLTEICIRLAGGLLQLAGFCKEKEEACERAKAQLKNGCALAKWKEMIAAQGGDAQFAENPNRLPKAEKKLFLFAEEEGYIASLNTEKCGEASVLLGAGRERKGDPIDPAAGILLKKKPGDFVRQGDILAELHFSGKVDPTVAQEILQKAYSVSLYKPELSPLIYEDLF